MPPEACRGHAPRDSRQGIRRVEGKVTAGDKTFFSYEARRSGTSAGARIGGVFMRDEDIQLEDIPSLVPDLTDSIQRLQGGICPRTDAPQEPTARSR